VGTSSAIYRPDPGEKLAKIRPGAAHGTDFELANANVLGLYGGFARTQRKVCRSTLSIARCFHRAAFREGMPMRACALRSVLKLKEEPRIATWTWSSVPRPLARIGWPRRPRPG